MSGTAPQDLPADEQPGELGDYDASDVGVDDDVIDISRNEGPELTTGTDDVDAGAAGGSKTANADFGDATGGSSTGAAVSGPTSVPDDEP